MKRNLNKLKNALVVITLSAAIISCGRENTTEADETAVTDSVPAVPTETSTQSYSLPSPLQIAALFKRAGMKYIDGLTNSVSDVSKYSSNTSKAINLGIYSSDLAYCTVNKQNQPSINYLKASRQLADQLGMGSVFEANNLSTRFENNLSNEDSLTAIIAELQMQTDIFMEDNEQEHIAATVFSGAWIESMYIGSKVYEKQKDSKISMRLSEQMTILDNILHVLNSYQAKDESLKPLIADLTSVNDSYRNFPSVKAAITAAAADTTGDGEPGEITLTEQELASVSTKITEIRAKLVKG